MMAKDASANLENGSRDEFVSIARIVKTRGVRGEVVAELLTDFPERFEGLAQIVAIDKDGARQMLDIERHWFHDGRIVFKFTNYDSPEAAQAIVGYELIVHQSECVKLEVDEFYDWQLIDCRIETIEGKNIGTVRDVLHTGTAPILVIKENGREHLVPFAKTICIFVDIREKLIRIDPPEGLLEI